MVGLHPGCGSCKPEPEFIGFTTSPPSCLPGFVCAQTNTWRPKRPCRSRFFDILITPVAMSGCGHRTVYQSDFCRMDVLFRKLLRMVVGTEGNLDWSRPWHEILHEWNMKVQTIESEHQLKLCSHRCLESYWKFGLYIANLPRGRWVPRALHWKPAGARVAGHPRHDWTLKFTLDGRFRYFCFRPDPMKNNEHFVGNFLTNSFQVRAPNTGCPQACRMNLNLHDE